MKRKNKIKSTINDLDICSTEYFTKLNVSNFIQLVSPQQVDQFSQNKLHWKALNKDYLYIC